MNYSGIKSFSIENGTGVRVSLFVSGCRHRCKGCFNEETWDFNHGELFSKEIETQIVESMKPDYMAGITLLGGDPGEPENQEALLPLLRRIRRFWHTSSAMGVLRIMKEWSKRLTICSLTMRFKRPKSITMPILGDSGSL